MMDSHELPKTEIPHPAWRSHPLFELFSRSKPGREIVRGVCGEIPPEIIEDEILLKFAGYINECGVTRAIELIRIQLPRELLIQLRAVRLNVAKMKAANGGNLPWAA